MDHVAKSACFVFGCIGILHLLLVIAMSVGIFGEGGNPQAIIVTYLISLACYFAMMMIRLLGTIADRLEHIMFSLDYHITIKREEG